MNLECFFYYKCLQHANAVKMANPGSLARLPVTCMFPYQVITTVQQQLYSQSNCR